MANFTLKCHMPPPNQEIRPWCRPIILLVISCIQDRLDIWNRVSAVIKQQLNGDMLLIIAIIDYDISL